MGHNETDRHDAGPDKKGTNQMKISDLIKPENEKYFIEMLSSSTTHGAVILSLMYDGTSDINYIVSLLLKMDIDIVCKIVGKTSDEKFAANIINDIYERTPTGDTNLFDRVAFAEALIMGLPYGLVYGILSHLGNSAINSMTVSNTDAIQRTMRLREIS